MRKIPPETAPHKPPPPKHASCRIRRYSSLRSILCSRGFGAAAKDAPHRGQNASSPFSSAPQCSHLGSLPPSHTLSHGQDFCILNLRSIERCSMNSCPNDGLLRATSSFPMVSSSRGSIERTIRSLGIYTANAMAIVEAICVNKKILLLPISIIGGVIVALLTGFISSPGRFIDVFRYGYPFPWTTRLIPMRFPIILVGNLVADMAIWTIIIGILLLAAVGARHLIAKSSIPVRQ